MVDLWKWMILGGIGLIILGGAFWVFQKIGFPLGQLPGDISVSKDNYSFYFPIVTTVVLSVFLTVLVNIILSIFKK